MRARTLIHTAAAALAALALGGPALPAQQDDREWLDRCNEQNERNRRYDRDERVRFCEVRETGMRPGGRGLTVDGRENGGVDVRGWDRDSVHVSVRIQTQAESSAEARDLARDIRVSTSGETIRAEGPSTGRRASWSVSYVVHVPRRTDLTVETLNGPVAVEDVHGRLDLRAVNGPLSLTGVSGDVRGRTTNGPVHVRLHGARWDGAGLDVETSNGPVYLVIPERYSARLETGTVNGPMSVDFPITVQGRIGRRLSTDLGSGGPPIRAMTTNGPVVLRRP